MACLQNLKALYRILLQRQHFQAILTAREQISNFQINNEGPGTSGYLKVYCSEQTHSSVEKAVKISGIGRKNLVKISVKEDFSMDPEKLKEAIKNDKRGNILLCGRYLGHYRDHCSRPFESNRRDLQ